VLYYLIFLQFWSISFEFTYYYYHIGFLFFFFWPFTWRNEGEVRLQREGTMRVRRTRQLKWVEVQDTVCSSRWNFAHVPLSRSLQPRKGRMAGKSRTVEVRFYKESRVLGCEGRGGGGREQMPLEYLYFTMQMEKYSQVHLQGDAGRRDGFIYIMHSLFFFLPPFVLQRRLSFYPSFFCSSFLCRFLVPSFLPSVLGMRVTVAFCHNNWMKQHGE